MSAGDDIVQNIFENPNETAEPTGKEVIFLILLNYFYNKILNLIFF
jgi:hypothetical protein